MQDMIDMLITHLPLLSNIFAIQQLSREIRLWARFVPQRRFKGILQRFVDSSLERFVTIMHETGSVITGSCALNMPLGDSYDSSSSDLNLIIPPENFLEMTTYLKEGGYINAEKEEKPHSTAMSSFLSIWWSFTEYIHYEDGVYIGIQIPTSGESSEDAVSSGNFMRDV
ncbi:hypothetical protein K503DRAFT_782970 [Rhizopogon vinicolor AM-OR11-026]|uniref:Uncharacterized protein n=1 Tax=Rhizopogon vinicolor AM-OR11-026 TaxID=1314800 RepID=A0A1B7N0E5_9AGAM|nr:hypothetical protein K503DRAFT_782970 [Rhizopogon vinicolor AM-OR11-026]